MSAVRPFTTSIESKQMNILTKIVIGVISLLSANGVFAQAVQSTDWNLWEPGGFWVPLLLIAGVVGLVVWIVKQKKRSSQL